MRQRNIAIVLVVVFVILCTVQISACTSISKIINNGKGGNTVENSNSATGLDNPDSLLSIEQRKKDIQQALIDNYDIFNQIVNYLENEPASFSCRKEKGKIIVQIKYENEPTSQIIDISEIEMGEQIEYVINDLEFSGIGESDDYIIFGKRTGEHPNGGSYWQNLICNKSNADDNKIQEKDYLPFGEEVRIKDEWYYSYGRNST